VAEATQITESQTDTVANTEADTQPSTETINSNIPQYYIVQKGDTLRTICFKIYGSYENMEKICSLNDIDNPDNILYGQKLLLP
jgi:nucleoid-associated protein YgaU